MRHRHQLSCLMTAEYRTSHTFWRISNVEQCWICYRHTSHQKRHHHQNNLSSIQQIITSSHLHTKHCFPGHHAAVPPHNVDSPWQTFPLTTCNHSDIKWHLRSLVTRLLVQKLSWADSMLAPSQWETSLQSNTVSHWLGANLESALLTIIKHLSSIQQIITSSHLHTKHCFPGHHAAVDIPWQTFPLTTCNYSDTKWHLRSLVNWIQRLV